MNHGELKLWNFYVRRGAAYLSPMAKTEAGFFVSIEPVDVVSIADGEALGRALKEMMSKGNPRVPTPIRDATPKVSLLEKANVKSISQFEKNAQLWQITAKDGVYKIDQMRRRSGRGWEDDPELTETLLPWPTLDEVAKRVVARVQATATKQTEGPTS